MASKAEKKRRRKLRQGQPVGARSASGRKRDRKPKVIHAAPGVIRRQEFYGCAVQTFDALGRACASGLLPPDLRDTGRVIAAQYWRVYGFATPDSLARFQPQNGVGIADPVKERIREDALNDALEMIRKRGHDVRRAFDSLVIDLNPDHGPAWLDRLVYAKRQKQTPEERDSNMLRLAIEGLRAIA